jgi:hypothetical protein
MQGVLKDWPSVINADTGELIARTYGPHAAASAALFASAPDLLEALKAVCGMTHENSGDALRRARALIAAHETC